MSVIRLLKSWAMRLATWPRTSIVWACRTSAFNSRLCGELKVVGSMAELEKGDGYQA